MREWRRTFSRMTRGAAGVFLAGEPPSREAEAADTVRVAAAVHKV